MTDSSSKTVGFVLYEGCTLLDFAGATQVFAPWAAHWKPVWLAPSDAAISTSEGVQVLPTHTFGKHPALDVVLVPGGGGDGVYRTMRDDVYLRWLREVAKDDKRWVGAVCVGTFILAAAGLLENARVTTHWLLLEELRRLSEKCGFTVAEGFERSVLDRGARRFTGGGVSASIDLGLELVKELGDVDTANAAALIIQYAPELPGGIYPGDPENAEPRIVTQVQEGPAKAGFVEPIARGVEELIERR